MTLTKITKADYLAKKQEMPTLEKYRVQQNEERTPRSIIYGEGFNNTNPVGIDFGLSTAYTGRVEGFSEEINLQLQLAARVFQDGEISSEDRSKYHRMLGKVANYFDRREKTSFKDTDYSGIDSVYIGKGVENLNDASKLEWMIKWINGELSEVETIMEEGSNTTNPITGKPYIENFVPPHIYSQRDVPIKEFKENIVDYISFDNPLKLYSESALKSASITLPVHRNEVIDVHRVLTIMGLREEEISRGLYESFFKETDSMIIAYNQSEMFTLDSITDSKGLYEALKPFTRKREAENCEIIFGMKKYLADSIGSSYGRFGLGEEIKSILKPNSVEIKPYITKLYDDPGKKRY